MTGFELWTSVTTLPTEPQPLPKMNYVNNNSIQKRVLLGSFYLIEKQYLVPIGVFKSSAPAETFALAYNIPDMAPEPDPCPLPPALLSILFPNLVSVPHVIPPPGAGQFCKTFLSLLRLQKEQ